MIETLADRIEKRSPKMPDPSLPQDPDAWAEPEENPRPPKCVVKGCDKDALVLDHPWAGWPIGCLSDDDLMPKDHDGWHQEFHLCEAHWISFDHVFACFVLDVAESIPNLKCISCGSDAVVDNCMCQKCGDELVACNKRLERRELILSTPDQCPSCKEPFDCSDLTERCPHCGRKPEET